MEWSEEEEKNKIKRCFWWNEVRIKWCSDGMKRGMTNKDMRWRKTNKYVFDGMKWGKKDVLVEWSEER